jgi:hypothetical protein
LTDILKVSGAQLKQEGQNIQHSSIQGNYNMYCFLICFDLKNVVVDPLGFKVTISVTITGPENIVPMVKREKRKPFSSKIVGFNFFSE